MRTSIFEIVMLVCFGAAWPFSIYRSLTSRALKFFDRLLVRALRRNLGSISRFRPEDLQPFLRQVSGGPS